MPAMFHQPFPPHILPQTDPSPVDLSVGDVRWQIAAARMVTDYGCGHNGEPIGNRHSSFGWYHRLPPTT